METNSSQEEAVLNSEANSSSDSSRREFFEKFGKYALYTPPVMFLLMNTQKEAVAGSCSGPRGCREQPRGRSVGDNRGGRGSRGGRGGAGDRGGRGGTGNRGSRYKRNW